MSPELLTPSWISTTMTSAPAAFNLGTSAFAVSASSAKRMPLIRPAETRLAVPLNVMPINPTETLLRPLPKVFSAKAGNKVCPFSLIVLAASCWNFAPTKGRSTRQGSAAVCFSQPPVWMRNNSAVPRSNSWLPTALNSRPTMFIAITDGSSRNKDEDKGEAPIRSPAATTTVFV